MESKERKYAFRLILDKYEVFCKAPYGREDLAEAIDSALSLDRAEMLKLWNKCDLRNDLDWDDYKEEIIRLFSGFKSIIRVEVGE